MNTHRNLIEPISGYPHIRKVLVKRFLKFLERIRKSPKLVPKLLLLEISKYVRSTTGSNLRKIMLQTDKTDVEKIDVGDVKCIEYHQLVESDHWKVNMIRELTDVRFENVQIDNLSNDEVNKTLEFHGLQDVQRNSSVVFT